VQVFSGYSHKIEDKEGIIITNTQYLLKHSEEIPKFDTLVIDEVHGMKKGSKLSKWVKKQDVDVRFAYTGTLPEATENIWNINGLIGPVLYKETVAEMQKKKILADIKIYPIRIFHTKKENYVINDYDDIVKRYLWECGILENCEEANNVIMQIAKNLKGNTLVLFDHIEHGNKLFKLLDYDNKCFVDGSVKLDDREITRQKMSIKQDCITVGNFKCVGTGITFSQLQNIILCGSGKSTTKIIQGLGRGLIKNKNHLNVFDIFHNYKYSTKHFDQRCNLYKEWYKIDFKIKQIEI
jgi:superfamily II DNA or RNA helicase